MRIDKTLLVGDTLIAGISKFGFLVWLSMGQLPKKWSRQLSENFRLITHSSTCNLTFLLDQNSFEFLFLEESPWPPG